MRRPIFALTFGVIVAMSAEAAPLVPMASGIDLGATPAIEQVRDHCGHGWHRTRWRDQWGYWHWGDCVQDGGPHGGWGAGWDYPPAYWRGAPPPWNSGYR